jgi:hypothetical protein
VVRDRRASSPSASRLGRSLCGWLIDRLRETYADTDDPHRKGALALAWALELTLEAGEEEPLEFGLPQVEAVLEVIETAAFSPGLLRLQRALRRLRGE